MEKLSTKLKQYISERIPQKVTNVFWQMFNGIDAMFSSLEYSILINKRERNILTAQHISSLRSLASSNGFEPQLKVPAKGLLQLKVSPKLFNRVGFPLFVKPYALFTDTNTKLTYYYDSNKAFRIDNNALLMLPVVEGEIRTTKFIKSDFFEISRIYISENNIANNGILLLVNNVEYLQVKSFFENDNINDNKQFIVKFSNDIQKPIVIYIRGLNYKDTADISYRLTNGMNGNIVGKHEFTIDTITDNNGNLVSLDSSEITIVNYYGLNMGSNGSDINMLRAAIGYNHGKELLFDNVSYQYFINGYSTMLLQKILNPENAKQINNIYLSKRQSLNTAITNTENVINQYKDIIDFQKYLLSKNDKQSFSDILSVNEYCLTSHNIYDSETTKYAVQLVMSNVDDIALYGNKLREIIYIEFCKFFQLKSHVINFEMIFDSFMKENNISFEYMIFDERVELEKFTNKTNLTTSYIIKHENYLPILKGNFNIVDSEFNLFKLFTDINIVVK